MWVLATLYIKVPSEMLYKQLINNCYTLEVFLEMRVSVVAYGKQAAHSEGGGVDYQK